MNVGLSVVIRQGELMMVVGVHTFGHLQPCVAELAALILGLETLQQQGWTVEGVESDCLSAVDMVNGCGDCFAEVVILVDRVRDLLPELGVSEFHYISRNANSVTDVVAKYVAHLEGHVSWLGVRPD
ncbi:hypothetical protein ACLB2K_063697 [Fragaria x ananassa]